MFINEPNHYDENLDRTGRTIDKERGISLVRLGGGGERPDLFALLLEGKQIAFEAEWAGNTESETIDWKINTIGQSCTWFGTKKGKTKKISKHLFRNNHEYEEIEAVIKECLETYTMGYGRNPIQINQINFPKWRGT